MTKKPPKVAYVVLRGRRPGIYNNWAECKEQVDGFPGAVHKGYESYGGAERAWRLAFPAADLWTNRPSASGNVVGLEDVEKAGTLKRSSPGSEDDSIDSVAGKKQKVGESSLPKEAGMGEMDHLDSGETPIILTAAQQAVVEMAFKGDNIFLTGAAGSGKTATLKEILKRLQQKYPQKNKKYPTVQITAPTGIAALPLKGKTTWSFAGWNMNSFKQPMEELLQTTKPATLEAMGVLRVLVIEEISMVENHFLERLDMLMRHVLKSAEPFGGKQVIIVGDFHQLPPVKPFESCLRCGEPMIRKSEGPVCESRSCPFQPNAEPLKWGDKWAFKAPVWGKLNLKHVKLEQIHRQKDTGFQSTLNKIRNGITLTDQEWQDLERKKDLPKGCYAIRLMSKVLQVRNFNAAKLAAIKSEPKSWTAIDVCKKRNMTEEDRQFRHHEIARKEQEHLASLKDHRFQSDLTLKVGAKVVLLFNLNIEVGLVNGSQGEVVGFVDTKNWSAKELEGEDGKWRAERVAEFTEQNSWRPIVRFAGGMQKAIPPVPSESLRGNSWDRYFVCRTQIPLTLGWALSIHKSQGMTLEHVELSSRDIFETGQLYVGLSRATTLGGLTVTGLNRKVLEMDPDVLAFYEGVDRWVDLGKTNKLAARSGGIFGASRNGGGEKGQMVGGKGSARTGNTSAPAMGSQAGEKKDMGQRRMVSSSMPTSSQASTSSTSTATLGARSDSQTSILSKIEVIDLT